MNCAMQLVRQLLHILSRQEKEDEGQHSWRGQNPGFDAAVPLGTVVTYKPPLCVPENLHRQRDWIRNRQGHTLLAVSVEMFPEVSLSASLRFSRPSAYRYSVYQWPHHPATGISSPQWTLPSWPGSQIKPCVLSSCQVSSLNDEKNNTVSPEGEKD